MAAAELLACCRTGLVAGQLLGYTLGNARTPRASQMEDAPVTGGGDPCNERSQIPER